MSEIEPGHQRKSAARALGGPYSCKKEQISTPLITRFLQQFADLVKLHERGELNREVLARSWSDLSHNLANALGRADCDSAALVEIALGCVKLRVRDDRLLAALTQRTLCLLDSLSAHAITKITWASARLGFQNEPFFEAVAEAALNRPREFSQRDRALLAWSLGLGDSPNSFEYVKDAYASLLQSKDPYVLLQIHQAAAARGIVPPALPESILRAIQGFNADSRANRFERSVQAVLSKLCSEKIIEKVLPRVEIAGIETDFVIVTKSGAWVVECDGADYHCVDTMHGGPVQPTGNDVIQDKIISRAGYRILHILDKVWSRLNPEGKFEFLSAALAGA